MAGTTRSNRSRKPAAKAGDAASIAQAFATERAACKALLAARVERDFERMASIVPGLIEARTRRFHAAVAGKRVSVVVDPISDEAPVRSGAYLVGPPQVGADARRLRLAAFEQDVPAAVLCREPLTRIKLLPIVAISPGTTVRVKVIPPKNFDKPELSWFIATLQALGDMAIDTVDPSMPAERRVDALLERLDAVPEHEGLHHALAQACVEAAAERDQAKAQREARAANRTPATARDDDDADNDSDDHADVEGGDAGEQPEASEDAGE